MRRLRIDPEMSRRIGSFGLSRNAVLRFRTNLRFHLEHEYSLYSSFRHPEDERCFLYLLSVADGDFTHRFQFVIDDSTSPDDLFIVDFKYRRDPA